MKYRKWLAGALALSLAAVLVACEASPSSPTGPSARSSVGGTRTAAIADPGLPQGDVTVKATAPGIVSPADGGVVNDPAVTLTVTSPQAVYDVPWTFNVEFEVFTHANPSSAIHRERVAQGGGSTSYQLPADVLQDNTFYVWRARAVSEGEGGPWSEVGSFTTTFVSIEPPTPLSPAGGTVTSSLRPQMFLANGEANGDAGRVLIEVHVATDDQFVNVVEVARTEIRGRGETGVPLQNDLAANTQYYWRGRHTNRDLPVTAVLEFAGGGTGISAETAIEITTPWSPTATFRTPTAAAAAPAPSSPGGGGGGGIGFGGTGSSPNAPFTTGGGGGPNMSGIVSAVAAANPGALANSCQEHGGTWEFMDRVVEALRAIDGRWGYNCKRGNCGDISLDVINYYRGSAPNTQAANGSTDVEIYDIILDHCGSSPQPAWINQTQATRDSGTVGRFIYPR